MQVEHNQAHTAVRYRELKPLIFDLAERYVAAGLWVVCVHSANCPNRIKRGKAPSHVGWQRSQLPWKALRHEMERIWAAEGGCNLGLKTGKDSGLICVDVDGKSNGLAWYYEHEMHLGRPVVERTGGEGGLHLYYKYPSVLRLDQSVRLETRSSAKRIFKGVDILGDGHGQVVTYPSLHATSGIQYVFDNGLNLIDAIHEADELPEWIVNEMLASGKASAEEAQRGHERQGSGASDLDVQRAIEFAQSAQPAVEGDGGDMQTLMVAMSLKDFGLSREQVYDVLGNHYNKRCAPPWSSRELRQKAENAFRYGRMSQGSNSVNSMFDTMSTDEIESVVDRAVRNGVEAHRAGRAKGSGDDSADDAKAAPGYNRRSPLTSAEFFIADHVDCLRGFAGNVFFYDWGRRAWSILSDRALDSQIMRHMQSSEAGKKAIKTMKPAGVADIRKFVQASLVNESEVPAARWLNGEHEGSHFVTLANGILNLKTLEVLPHSPNWFSIHSLDCNFDEHAGCPRFLSFLEQIWEGDDEMIESLRLWCGYCIMSSANLQKFAVFKGASRGGKSTLMSVVEGVLGRPNCATSSLSLIGSDFGLESIIGKKLVIFQDAERASLDRMGVATERIKSLASDDPVTINRKNQSMITQRLACKVNFVCNRVPNFLNDEGSLTKRMIVFPFWRTFEGQEDFSLLEKLLEEREGIFAWAVSGAHRLLHGHKLFTAQKGLEALLEVQQQLDSVAGFASECLREGGEHNFVHSKELWSSYRQWCRDSGRQPKNRQKFFTEVSAMEPLRGRRTRTRELRGYRNVICDVELYDGNGRQGSMAMASGYSAGDDDEDDDAPPF